MDTLEGTLMVPPDRGHILGRPSWKPRHVVVGPRASLFREHQNGPTFSQVMTTTRVVSSGKPQSGSALAQAAHYDDYFISIFKSKDDHEPYQQWPLTCVTDCSVQMLAKRKQGPALPTLLVTVIDKERKRRSSRAGSLIPNSNKENATPALWFRACPEEPGTNLQNWARFICAKKGIMSPGDSSPITPTSTTQTFSPRQGNASDYFPRPTSGHNQSRSLHHKSSTATHSTGTRERPLTFSSESPSLRSKRSDVSSPSSNYPVQQYAYAIPGQQYTTVLPTDLPSPVNTTSDTKGDSSGGWNIDQGRESAVSSPQQGRDSRSSHLQQPSLAESSSPPAPRETILDRYFQVRSQLDGNRPAQTEDKLSSIARFDAEMREKDDKRRQKAAVARADQMALRSAFEADDSSDYAGEEEEDTDTDDGDFSQNGDQVSSPLIPPTAHRALQYVTGRTKPAQSPTSPRPGISRNPLSFHADSMPALTQTPPARPHTAHDKTRRDAAQRSQSTQYLPSSFSVDMSNISAANGLPGRISEETTPRQSSSSNKRLSFTEFTKRLSSTSSLLLVQTNTSGASSQRSSEIDVNSPVAVPRTSLRPPGGTRETHSVHSTPRERTRDDLQEKRYSCRVPTGMIGSEGGFF